MQVSEYGSVSKAAGGDAGNTGFADAASDNETEQTIESSTVSLSGRRRR